MKRRYIVIVAFLLLLVMPLAWLSATESGLRWVHQQLEVYQPGELHITSLNGRLIGPITLRGIEFQQDGNHFKAEQVTLNWRPIALLVANINISSVIIESLEIVLAVTEKTEQELTLPEISLPWRVVLNDAQINGLSVIQGEQSFTLNTISLDASSLFSQVDIDTLSVSAESFSFNVEGELRPTGNYRHDLKIQWQTELPSAAIIEGKGRLVGDVLKTRINQHLTGPLQLKLDAEVNDILTQLNWQTRIDVTAFDTSQFGSEWPALNGVLKLDAKGDLSTAALAGTLKANNPELGKFDASFNIQRLSDNSIQFDELKLHEANNDTQLDINGLWMPGENGGTIKLSLDWKKLRWPMQDPPWFNSASGSGAIEGNIDRYQIKLTTDSPWPEYVASTWTASAVGNQDSLEFHALRVTAMNGEANVTGQLNWSPVLSWQAEVSAVDIDPASRWPQWPGQLNAKLTSKGRIENGELLAETDISQVTGTLRNYPVSLSSRLVWRNKGLDINLLDFRSGEAHVSAKGRIGENLQLDWSIDANKLAELYPQAQGQLHAKGLLTGPRLAPTIQATFKGESLMLPGYEVGVIDGALSVDLFQWQQLDINLAAQTLELNGYSLETLNITSVNDRIEAKAVSEKLTALIALQGKANAQGWNGRIEQAEISSEQFQDWQLKTPSAVNITANAIEIQPLCWLSDDSDICMTLNRHDDIWQSTLKARQMPTLLLSPWLPADLKLEGAIDATAELQYHAPGKLLGKANFTFTRGAVSYPLLEGERERWEYRGGTVAVSLNEQGVTTASEIAMSNGDRFQLKAELPGAQILRLDVQRQKLIAEAQMEVHDLGLIEALLPEVQDLKGDVALNVTAAGTLAQPKISGRGHLHNGALRIPRLGLTIDQLSLNSESDGLDSLHFRLDAHSGDGKLVIQGKTILDKIAGWPTEISIKGKEFEVSRIPEAQAQVSPDLQVKLKNRTINIKGDVHVPYAKLQPRDITTASRVTNDAVIVGGEQPPGEKWLVHTRIRLTLGERVSVFGFGFEGRLGGSILLEDEPGQLIKATGEINIPEGRYRAYGQRLDVEHGRLIYTGGPLTNPGLDLRAVRHVDAVTAGIKVRGSLNQPQLELFSTPAMGQTDAMAYLMLGGPIEKASNEDGAMMAKAALALGLSGGDHLARTLGDRFGLDEMRVESSEKGDQASLVVGRYLSPKLYVSYGVGLVEAFNTLTLRYKISDRWQLKTESGEHQGADFLYTIER